MKIIGSTSEVYDDVIYSKSSVCVEAAETKLSSADSPPLQKLFRLTQDGNDEF